ncbi:MAG TPA: recombinase family protein [Thermoanaerobaculia bacterium]|jgi:site-specific DNA recombinase|nr:recombinase family protein [Thermoanaerobaculia bacterium]
MKQLFAYIRVSGKKQTEGVSLPEQRAIIKAYADRIGATIIEWFEETRTAAKAGRPVFARMTTLLRAGKAEGVIIHKLDRGTRNFRDWAEIDELIEGGIDIYVANDNLDLRSRGGRLAADVQIAVAVDYIRNLREEALKGIHGRLKQGILPGHAPIGYLDRGGGKPKAIDPVRGPLVRHLFEFYATGAYTLRDLTAEGIAAGLRSLNGNSLRLTQIQKILRNPFYAGMIRSRRFGLFTGAHEPLIKRSLFDRVQTVLDGKFVRRTKQRDFLFRRMLHCMTCQRSLIATAKKGRVYYRCSNVECPTTSVREDRVDAEIRELLAQITLTPEELTDIGQKLADREKNSSELVTSRRSALQDALLVANARMTRLTDLLLDGKIEAAAHDERRAVLVMERQKLGQDLAGLEDGSLQIVETAKQIVELARCPVFLYETADSWNKRRLLEIVLSNCTVTGKTVEFSLREPFAEIAKRSFSQQGGPHWNTPRTFPIEALICWASECPQRLREHLQLISLEAGVKTRAA